MHVQNTSVPSLCLASMLVFHSRDGMHGGDLVYGSKREVNRMTKGASARCPLDVLSLRPDRVVQD